MQLLIYMYLSQMILCSAAKQKKFYGVRIDKSRQDKGQVRCLYNDTVPGTYPNFSFSDQPDNY